MPLSFYNSDTEDVTFCDYRVCLILSFIFLSILTSKCGEKTIFLTQMVWFRENWYEEVLRQLKQGLAKCHAVAFENRGASESGVLVMLMKGSVLHDEFLSFQWLMKPSPPTP